MKILLTLCLLFFFSIASAQQVICNGSVVRKVTVKGSIRELPYPDVRVLLVNTTHRAINYDRSICNDGSQRYPADYVKTFTTDSKGNYNFSYPYRANSRYCLIICTGSRVVRITIPSSSDRYITVPTQYF